MTQKTKLEIIGPYTPDHEGPFCTRDGLKARIICLDRVGDWPIVALVSDGEGETIRMYSDLGRYSSRVDHAFDLMNAREVPVAREFWIRGGVAFRDKWVANNYAAGSEIVHVREVLPGDGE